MKRICGLQVFLVGAEPGSGGCLDALYRRETRRARIALKLPRVRFVGVGVASACAEASPLGESVGSGERRLLHFRF